MKTKEEKMKILERLVKEGHITLCEAFDLSEATIEYIHVPYNPSYTNPVQPYTPQPFPWEPVFGTPIGSPTGVKLPSYTISELETMYKDWLKTEDIVYK